jgi:hypothetical protein
VIASPVLHGAIRAGATVTVGAGRWAGGFGIETDQLGIEACRPSSATGCVMLSGEQLSCRAVDGCGSNGGPIHGPVNRARIGTWYSGWYLFALDARLDNTASGLVGYGVVPPWSTWPTVVRSVPYGPASGPRSPHISFLRTAVVRGGVVLVGRVRCSSPCYVAVSVDDRRTASDSYIKVDGSSLVGVPRNELRSGRLYVGIAAGGGPTISGRTELR